MGNKRNVLLKNMILYAHEDFLWHYFCCPCLSPSSESIRNTHNNINALHHFLRANVQFVQLERTDNHSIFFSHLHLSEFIFQLCVCRKMR